MGQGVCVRRHISFDVYRWDSQHSEGIRRLQIEAASRSDALVERISSEVTQVLDLLGRSLPETIIVGSLHEYLYIDAPRTPPQPDDSAYLITPNDQLVRFDKEYAETRDWVNVYHLTRDVGFIFAPLEIATEVFGGSREFLRTEFGIRTPRMAAEYAHLSMESITEMKQQLRAAGYYTGTPYDVRPESDILPRGDIPARGRDSERGTSRVTADRSRSPIGRKGDAVVFGPSPRLAASVWRRHPGH